MKKITFLKGNVFLRLVLSASLALGSGTFSLVSANATNQTPVVTLPDWASFVPNPPLVTRLTVDARPYVKDDGLPNGSLSYQWVDKSAIPGVSISSPTSLQTDITFPPVNVPAPFAFELKANDGERTGTDSYQIWVVPKGYENQPPKVQAGPDQTIYSPVNSAFLDGNVQDDGLRNSISSRIWEQVSGPTEATIETPSALDANTNVSFMEYGEYVFRLTAHDGEFGSFDEVKVSYQEAPPENMAPIVNAGDDQVIDRTNNALVLRGTASDDGLPTQTLTTTWTQISGPAEMTINQPNALETSVRYSVPGNYVFRFSASDGHLVSQDDVNISVLEEAINQAPTVDLPTRENFRYQRFRAERFTFDTRAYVNDDGLPNGSLTLNWNDHSAIPGTVITDAGGGFYHFDIPLQTEPTKFLFHLGVSDGQLGASDEMEVWFIPEFWSNQRPVANAGPDHPDAEANVTYAVQGTFTDDGLPNGEYFFNWYQVSGPTEANIHFPHPETDKSLVGLTFPQDGIYELEFLASDYELGGTDRVKFFVGDVTQEPVNQRPNVFAGVDHNLIYNSPTLVDLLPSVSDDGLPNGTLTYFWEVVSGPSTINILTPESKNTQASIEGPGDYVLRLNVSDGALAAQDELTISATQAPSNEAPTVSFPERIVYKYHSINNPIFQFDAQPYVQDDGQPNGVLHYLWNDASTVSGSIIEDNVSPLVRISVPAQTDLTEFRYKLTVGDGRLNGSDTLKVIYVPEGYQNKAPIVSAGQDQVFVGPEASLPLEGEFQDDGWPEDVLYTFQWRQIEGPEVNLSFPERLRTGVTVSEYGTYRFELTVSDGDLSGTDAVTFTVHDGRVNEPPVVDAGQNTPREITEAMADLHGQVTDDGLLNDIPTLRWTQQSGPPSALIEDESAEVTTVQFSENGTYVFRLTAFDGEYTAFDEVTLEVNLPENQAPFVLASDDQMIEWPTETTAQFGAQVSDDGLPEGQTLQYQWTQISGPSQATLDGAETTGVLATFSEPGIYTFQIDVFDGELTSTDQTIVSVEVYNPNDAPLVDAGEEETIFFPSQETVYLDATASDDGLPHGVMTYNWVLLSPQSGVHIMTPNEEDTEVIIHEPGVFTFQLEVDDGDLTSRDEVIITVQEDNTSQNQAPTVMAAPDFSITLPALAGLNASASDDGLPNGTLEHMWTQISGPADSTISSPDKLSATAQVSEPGTYIFQITTSDGDLFAQDEITVTVNEPSAQIDVSVENFQWTQWPIMGTASGRATVTPSGPSITYEWRQTLGSPATIENPTQASTRIIFSEQSFYTFELTATANGASNSATLTIDAQNPPFNSAPIANAGPDQTVSSPNNSALLSGSAIDDGQPTGQLFYNWRLASGPASVTFDSPQSAQTNVTFSTLGSYTLRLTVSDGDKAASDNVVINYVGPNQAPVVSAGDDQTITLPANTAQLNGSATDDGQPEPLTYAWTKVSGPGSVQFNYSNRLNPVATFERIAGTYVLRFSADDGSGPVSDEVAITIAPQNQAPRVDAGQNQSITLPNNTAQLNGTVTDDGLPQNGQLTQIWTKVSGPGTVSFSDASVTNPNATFDRPGSYTLRLLARDGSLSSSDQVIIDVIDPNPNLAPTVNAGPDQRLMFQQNQSITLSGSATDDGNPNGQLTLQWIKLSGPNGIFMINHDQETAQVTISAAGIYTFQLRADDGALIGRDDVTITVIDPATNQPPTVSAGSNQSLTYTAGATVHVFGFAMDNTLFYGPLITKWRFVSPPGGAPGIPTIENENAAETRISFSAPGTYTFEFSADDGEYTSVDYMHVELTRPAQSTSPNRTANPVFNPNTEEAVIPIESGPGNIEVRVFNIRGEEIDAMNYTATESGEQEISWDGRTSSGNKVSSGIYHVLIDGPSGVQKRKIAVLK